MKKNISVLLIIAMIFTMAGCGRRNAAPEGNPSGSASPEVSSSPEASSAAETQITVTDSRGVEVTFDQSPSKIISLLPSDTETLYALDCGERIIAVSEYCNYPEDTAAKKKLPTGEKLDLETLIGMDPDAVFIGKMAVMDDQIKQLEDAGVKVIVTEANDLAGTYKIIELIGKVMGKSDKAKLLAESMQKGFDRIREEVKGKDSKTVYVEVSPLQYGLWSCGKNTFVQELIDMIGAKNIFDDIEGWQAVSEEEVLKRDPEIILTTASPVTGIEDPVGEIMSRANWKDIKAVKNNKVIMLDADMISRPGPRLLDAAEELAKAVYSE